MRATIVDLRYRMKDVLGALDRGETVIVLHRGKERAKLTPIPSTSGASAEEAPMTKNQSFFGLWSDREDLANPDVYVRKLRRNRVSFAQPDKKNRPSPGKRK